MPVGAVGKLAINLIPKEEFRKRSWEKFLSWVLTYGRYIIIGTEVIVLCAFLFRFKLDRELMDLSDEVKKQQTMIESFREIEEQTRALQKHLTTIKLLGKGNPAPTEIMNSLASLTPQDVIFSQLKVSSSKINLSATAFSLGGFSAFLEALKQSKEFKDISLDKLIEGQGGLEFSLKFNYQD